MYNNTDEEIPLKLRLTIYAVCAALVLLMAAGSVAYATWQRNQAAETQRQRQAAAALLQQQIANAERIKTGPPALRLTGEFKSMSLVKVNVDELPKVISAGLDETVDPQGWPTCDPEDTYWQITAYNDFNGTVVASSANPNGWASSGPGNVSIPAGASHGKYTLYYLDQTTFTEDCNMQFKGYTFKITPKCPTQVTLAVPSD